MLCFQREPYPACHQSAHDDDEHRDSADLAHSGFCLQEPDPEGRHAEDRAEAGFPDTGFAWRGCPAFDRSGSGALRRGAGDCYHQPSLHTPQPISQHP